MWAMWEKKIDTTVPIEEAIQKLKDYMLFKDRAGNTRFTPEQVESFFSTLPRPIAAEAIHDMGAVLLWAAIKHPEWKTDLAIKRIRKYGIRVEEWV